MIEHFKFKNLGNHNYGWLNARYHFNFANYYNPSIKPKTPLIVWNDDTIKPNTGFPMHSHQNMEIITYIRKGLIVHEDSIGNKGEIQKGEIQIMSAGSGITHSEFNYGVEDTLLFQIWIEPNKKNIKPRWENISIKDYNLDSINVLASGETQYAKSDILKINQDASIIKINGSDDNLSYQIRNNRHVYFVLEKGKVKINNHEINERDGVYIINENKINFNFIEDSEIIMVDMIQK